MLVLSRTRHQRILAGLVAISVVDIRGDKVRLGIDAPEAIPIHREEILLAIMNDNPSELHRLGYEVNSKGLVVPRQELLDGYEDKFQ